MTRYVIADGLCVGCNERSECLRRSWPCLQMQVVKMTKVDCIVQIMTKSEKPNLVMYT